MDWSAVCAAVIPCLNEEAAIGPLVQGVRNYVETVFVVDDGSSDDTSAHARAAHALVVRQPTTLGKGAALQAGWRRAQEAGFVWALSLDGDGQHSPQDIPRFFGSAQSTGASLVVGNRMGEAFRMPWMRRWVNRAMSWQLSRMAGQALPDSQCGFRLMNLREWARLPITTRNFEIESEVLFQFAASGLRIEFVPIQVIYKKERSKIHPVRDTIRWLRWRRHAIRRLRSS